MINYSLLLAYKYIKEEKNDFARKLLIMSVSDSFDDY